MLAHVPVLCQNQEIPLLVLNGKATLELGTALGIRKTSIVLILPKSKNDNDVNDEKAIDSFCNYVVSLIESE
jgi:ribosomal protein L7Ae-like RNA K-turn-binding protein